MGASGGTLQSVACVNALHCFAVGSSYYYGSNGRTSLPVIITTTDGGQIAWSDVAVPSTLIDSVRWMGWSAPIRPLASRGGEHSGTKSSPPASRRRCRPSWPIPPRLHRRPEQPVLRAVRSRLCRAPWSLPRLPARVASRCSQFTADPVGTPGFSVSGEYFDVRVSSGNTFTSLDLKDCNLNGGKFLVCWNSARTAERAPGSRLRRPRLTQPGLPRA